MARRGGHQRLPAADVSARWPKLRDQVLHRRLSYELSDHCAARRPLLEVVRADPGPDGRAWHEYLRLVGGPPNSAPQHRARILADHIATLGEPHRELAGRYALHEVVTHTTSIDDVAVAAAVLVPLFGDDWAQAAELVLRGGLRATLASRRPESGLAALAYVALYLVEPGVVRRLKRTGELARAIAAGAGSGRLFVAGGWSSAGTGASSSLTTSKVSTPKALPATPCMGSVDEGRAVPGSVAECQPLLRLRSTRERSRLALAARSLANPQLRLMPTGAFDRTRQRIPFRWG